MTIKQRKIILHFLKQLDSLLENTETDAIHSFFDGLLSREELIEMYKFFFQMDKVNMGRIETDMLLKMIGSDVNILDYYINQLEESITASPSLSEEEKKEFFSQRNLETHYLYAKPTKAWDSYDISNYYSLLWKHGKTKRVWAIFTSDVNEEDKYAVTTKPSFFFDTEDEAIAEIENILKEKKFQREDLKVMSLWHLI